MQDKTWAGKILAAIWGGLGSIFKHVIEGAEKTFNELPQEQKDALKNGSGIMEIIKTMLTATPAEVRAAIQEQYPDLNEADLETGLFAIAHTFNLAPEENNLDDVIAKLQQHLQAATSNSIWDGILHTGSLLLAVALAPQGTIFGAIANLAEYVYRKYIQKDPTA